MRRVMQTRTGFPDGNCLAACLASIFEIDIESVPDFGVGPEWYDKFTAFMLDRFGLVPIDVDYDTLVFQPKGFHIINGRSPRLTGRHHAIVGLDGDAVHDPFPGGNSELAEITSLTLFVKVIEDRPPGK